MLKDCNCIEKRLQHECFLVITTKFLRTSILKNICKRLLLYFCTTSMTATKIRRISLLRTLFCFYVCFYGSICVALSQIINVKISYNFDTVVQKNIIQFFMKHFPIAVVLLLYKNLIFFKNLIYLCSTLL